MNFNYNVPIISSNLRREETIVQIADTLHYLSEVANDIFRRINDRIELNSRKLLTVKKRIKDVDYKVVKLAGEKKAVQVYSSCKYPAAHLNPKYNVIFCCENKLQPKRTQYKYSETVITKEEAPDRLEYYHVKTKKTLSYYNTKDLDKIPENLEFFTDLLLYNTGKNLFKDYLILDPLETNLIPKENYQCNGSKIEDAPVSISHQKVITSNYDDSYFYSPNLGEVPMLEVPLDLPDLPGVANDLRYETAESFGIAPSSGISSPVDIKIIANSKDTNANSVENIVVDKKTNKIATEEVSLKSTTKIEKLKVVESPESKTNVAEVCNKVSLPENPPEVNKISEDNICLNEELTTGNTKNKEKIDLFVTNNTAHTTLMEAIRKAGGVKNANLKNTTSKKLETSSVMSGGDLMADLHAKLSLRRKGISGAKSNNNCIDIISTFARISDLIPLPPPSSGNEEENDATEDDEWDD